MTLNNLAVFYKSQQRYADAETFYQRALSIFERTLVPDHRKLVACRDNFAKLVARMCEQER